MLSLQYLNKRLKKNHIEQILTNYNIKYTTMKKEIENKINIMIKTFTEDISAFLNNLEEIAEKKHQIKTIESNQNELESLREQAKENNHEKNKLRREIELLRIEINRLKSNSSNNNSNNNNNTTSHSSRKKINFSPNSPSSKDISYQCLNTISNFNNITSPLRKSKDTSSLLLRTEKKEKKEIKDSRIFKSPQVSQIKKSKKKITDLNSKENSNNIIKNIRKKEINKTHKNTLSSSTSEVITESNKNEKNSTYSLAYKNKKLNNKISSNKGKIKNNKSSKFVKNIEKSNKNSTFIQSEKQINKKIDILKNKENEKIPKDNEEYSSEKENNIDIEDDNIENKSKTTTEDNEEEITIIDEEINEMNLLEEEILSLMGKIKEFKQQNNDLT